jgi:hypothetical protein
MGVIQQSNLGHIRQTTVTEGATVYPGEVLSTDIGGMIALTIGTAAFRLLEGTRAVFFAGANGPVAELRNGTLTYRKEAGAPNLTIFASDVKVVTKGDAGASGHILILNPCEVRVSTGTGLVEVTSGDETQAMGERETYSVTPDNAVIEIHSAVSPVEPGYHESHTHKSCRPDQNNKKWGSAPVGTGSSHFLKLAAIGGAAVIGLLLIPKGHGHGQDESPSVP